MKGSYSYVKHIASHRELVLLMLDDVVIKKQGNAAPRHSEGLQSVFSQVIGTNDPDPGGRFVIAVPPKAVQSFRYGMMGNKVARYPSKGATKYKQAIKTEMAKLEFVPFESGQPIEIAIIFWFAPPKSLSKKKRLELIEQVYVMKKIDIDNLLKGTLDALTWSKLWPDDSQIVRAQIFKMYTAQPTGYIDLACAKVR